MEILPAIAGWLWVKEGFLLFRKKPVELTTLFLTYVFLMLGICIIPIIGKIAAMVLVPTFSIGFLQACLHVERGEPITQIHLFAGFKSPARKSLLKLGVVYLSAAIFAIAVSSVIDGGMLWDFMTGQKIPKENDLQLPNTQQAILFAMCTYNLIAVLLWFTAPLVGWKNMPVSKAIFYSFFSVFRTLKCFIAYGLSWLAIAIATMLAASISAIMLGALIGTEQAQTPVALALLIASAISSLVSYCAVYRSYAQVFGLEIMSPELEPEPKPEPPNDQS